MRFRHIQMTRISARIQAFFLVAALALMLGLAGWLLGGIEMALGTLIAVLGLYWLQPLMAPQLMFRIQGGRPLAPQTAPVLPIPPAKPNAIRGMISLSMSISNSWHTARSTASLQT